MISLNKKAQILKDFTQLIETNQTGNATCFAKRIKVSRSSLYELFDELRCVGIEFTYSKEINSFQYKNNLRLKINTPIEVLSENEYSKVNGGTLQLPVYQICI